MVNDKAVNKNERLIKLLQICSAVFKVTVIEPNKP